MSGRHFRVFPVGREKPENYRGSQNTVTTSCPVVLSYSERGVPKPGRAVISIEARRGRVTISAIIGRIDSLSQGVHF
jgi:hypothetical protein